MTDEELVALNEERGRRKAVNDARVLRSLRAKCADRPDDSITQDMWIMSQGGGLRESLRRYLRERRGISCTHKKGMDPGIPPWKQKID